MKQVYKKRFLLVLAGLFLLLAINLFITYSYFQAEIIGVESVSTIDLDIGYMTVRYDNLSDNIIANDIYPGWTTTKNFTITGNIPEETTNLKYSELYYVVKLVLDSNDLLDNSMVCSLTLDPTSGTAGTPINMSGNLGIPSKSTSNEIILGYGKLPKGENVHVYNLKLEYLDRLDVDQTQEMGAKFSSHVVVDGVNPSFININLDYNDEITNSESIYAVQNSATFLPKPSRLGYLFNGWELVSGDAEIYPDYVLTKSGDVSLKALWVRDYNYVQIDIDLNGGTSDVYSDKTFALKNSSFNLIEPTREGYVFLGWKVSGTSDLSDGVLQIGNDNISVQAQWESSIPTYTYTGDHLLINDGSDNWRIKFLSSGTLTFNTLGNARNGIDVFLVGGGGGGGQGYTFWNSYSENYFGGGGGGGGGGYAATANNISILTNNPNEIVIGAGGGAGAAGAQTSAFTKIVNGGSAGGGGGANNSCPSGCSGSGGAGGNAGGKGGDCNNNGALGGSGSIATKEFEETTGTQYAGGGSGGGGACWQLNSQEGASGGGGGGAGNEAGLANTGGGGGGGTAPTSAGRRAGQSGGSGIVVIRNHR